MKEVEGNSGPEAGSSLVEILVAVAIIALTLTVLITALSTGALAVRNANRLTTANNLSASQLEVVKGADYDPGGGYDIIPAPEGYSVLTSADVITTGLQQVTVTVSYEGETLMIISNHKVDR